MFVLLRTIGIAFSLLMFEFGTFGYLDRLSSLFTLGEQSIFGDLSACANQGPEGFSQRDLCRLILQNPLFILSTKLLNIWNPQTIRGWGWNESFVSVLC